MLVVSRRKGQRIVIRDREGNLIADIEVTSLHRSSCKLGVIAAPTVSVVRAELEAVGPDAGVKGWDF